MITFRISLIKISAASLRFLATRPSAIETKLFPPGIPKADSMSPAIAAPNGIMSRSLHRSPSHDGLLATPAPGAAASRALHALLRRKPIGRRCGSSFRSPANSYPIHVRCSPSAHRPLSASVLVIHPDAGDAKNTTALAMSSGSPMRPIIACAAKRSSVACQSAAPRPLCVRSVRTKPGATAFTVMPYGPSSRASL